MPIYDERITTGGPRPILRVPAAIGEPAPVRPGWRPFWEHVGGPQRLVYYRRAVDVHPATTKEA